MPSPPSLSRSDVRTWTLDRYYDRGERYYRQDRIQRPRREDRLLKAECRGSRPNPYHVEAKLDADGIAWAECSCPVGGGCKHAVALLLTWVESPEEFEDTDPLEELLREQSPSKLVPLILKMVDRHPDLERLVRLSATSTTASVDAGELRDQIQSVFENVGSQYDYRRDPYHQGRDPYYAPREVKEDLDPFFTMAEDYAENDRLADAATVYRLLLEETQAHYENFHGEEGELGSVVEDCARHLGELLATVDDEDLRDTILRALFDTYTWDLDLGGYSLGDWSYDALINKTTQEERHRVADWVRDRLPNADLRDETLWVSRMSGDDSWSSNWKHEALGGFLLDLEKDTLDDETYLRICRESGRLTDLVERLLDLDRLDEALDAVREASDYEVYKLTSTFNEYGYEEALHDRVLDRLNEATDSRLVEWLRDYAEEHDDTDRALSLSRRLFWKNENESAYRDLQSVAQEAGRWPEVQSDIHDQLREQDDYGLLTRLHLANDNIEAALEILPKADASFSWSYNRSPLPIAVAEAAEDEYPDEAIRIYTERGRSLIAERGRDNYQDAAELFQRVKALYDQHQPGAWDDVLEALYDDELHRLPAARDEFEQADLL
ncbi:MAG: SWIM zinc finger domain-containing protein [Salinibacter sp.]